MWREGYVLGGDTRFFVRVLGTPGFGPGEDSAERDDELIVLLHGWPEDGSAWRHVAPILADAGYRVACPDLKGLGRTRAPHGSRYDPESLADEISRLIRNLHARKAVLVGHDWGGPVAVATAFRHPGLVRALVVASAPLHEIDLRRSWHIPLLNLPVLPEIAFRVAPRPLVAAGIRHAARHPGAIPDDAVDAYARGVAARPGEWLPYYRGLARRAALEAALRRLRRRSRLLSDPPERHHLRVPAAVVWGEQDPVTPFPLAAGVARDLEAEVVAIPDAGHFVHEESPLAVAQAILDLAGPGAYAREGADQR
ncbi:alpha/beta fold hydrolase [Egicoccus halophilus]|uniref:Epoxide hydrolase n=1 Tax=Egicoccus halophilus TaxID=1670830 RepID=A0A8J3A8P3_9ACTN|nr:alpha/beta hydrolase [Egicoccus halophilus]GGI07139.1 epoxide hydrolase [Egicoccus halophilus]